MQNSESVAAELEPIEGLPPLIGVILSANLASRPSQSLDPLLDAAERCLARTGFTRTTMSDLAREMKVARSTLYRQIDSVERAIQLIVTRMGYRFLDEITAATLGGPLGSDMFTKAVLRLISTLRGNPAVRRLLENEPELLGQMMSHDVRQYVERRVVEVAAPGLAEAMAAGVIRKDDPQLAAQWLLRVAIILLLAPPDDNPEPMVKFALRSFFPDPAPGSNDS